METMSTDNTNALQIHTHQAGITALGTTDHAFIELNLVDNSAEAARTAVTALADAINLPTTVGANVVVGVRPSLWAQVANPNDVPEGVHDFNAPIRGEDGYQMPATQKDAWIWVASASRSQTFNVAQHITKQLADNWKLSSETTGWVYEFNRDLTGFEDGTENPGALKPPVSSQSPMVNPAQDPPYSSTNCGTTARTTGTASAPKIKKTSSAAPKPTA